jgi:hypothetical protein
MLLRSLTAQPMKTPRAKGRPHPTYFGAFFIDPDGNKLEAVTFLGRKPEDRWQAWRLTFLDNQRHRRANSRLWFTVGK